MLNITVLQVALAFTFFAAIAATPYYYSRFDNFYAGEENLGKGGSYKDIVFGSDVAGAKQLANTNYSYFSSREEAQISSCYSYPHMSGANNNRKAKITKIVVRFKESDDDGATEATVKEGGVGENHVSLLLLVRNSRALIYSITVYGIESN